MAPESNEPTIADERIAAVIKSLRDSGGDADAVEALYADLEQARFGQEAADVVLRELRTEQAELIKRAEDGEAIGGIAAQLKKNGDRLGRELAQLLEGVEDPKQYPSATWLARALAPAPSES